MNIITKQKAMALGLKRYFTGKPCRNGHIMERSVYGTCFGCSAEHDKKRYATNPEKILARSRRWRIANPDKIRMHLKKWGAKNPERLFAIKKKWQDANPDKISAKGKRWRLANKDRCCVHKHTRRTKERGNGGNHTHEDIAEILAMQGGKCAYFSHCGTILTHRNKHLDHIIPIVAGGSNNRNNIQFLCRACNLHKHAKDPIIHCQSLGWLL